MLKHTRTPAVPAFRFCSNRGSSTCRGSQGDGYVTGPRSQSRMVESSETVKKCVLALSFVQHSSSFEN